jgi:Tfp pilus assembly protein PilX
MDAKMGTPGKVEKERGAALVTVVLITVLLLIAIVAMLSSVSSHTQNVSDVYSETKAYYAAESGIQATINVLRGNTLPIQPFTNANAEGVVSQKINYKRATNPVDSNHSDDIETEYANVPRLSRWISYNYTPSGKSVPDRVVLGDPAGYTPNSGMAYSVQVNDPDNTQESLTFSTSFSSAFGTGEGGRTITFAGATSNDFTSVRFTTYSNRTIDFTGQTVPNPEIFAITVQKNGAGGLAVNPDNSVRAYKFDVAYRITAPRTVSRVIRGTVTLMNSNSQVQVTLTSYAYTLAGSELHLCGEATCSTPLGSGGILMAVPATQGQSSESTVFGEVTPLEPYRLQLVSTGFGPNGARKKLETIIQKNFFNDLQAPAAIALIGPPGPNFLWAPGTSKNVSYCGVPDSDPDDPCTWNPETNPHAVPPIGVTNGTNLGVINDPENQPKTAYVPAPAEIGTELPDWLSSPAGLDEVVQSLKASAEAAGTFYASGVQPSSYGTYDAASDSWSGVTFCDGNCSLTGNGGGMLVVRGKLTLQGNFNFKGLIIVTGPDGVVRQGAGNGAIIGNLVVAPYASPTQSDFNSPRYDMRGGGISDFIYSGSSTSFNGQSAISDFVLGVAEK